MVPTRIQNSWKLNQATRKDHFSLSFIDQVLYADPHNTLNQHKITFTCPFGTFTHTRILFGLCNAPSTF
ncbi:hypothetical protein CR513_29230, partial [Mucuna pruriens]